MKRELDRVIAEKYFGVGRSEEDKIPDSDELHGWSHHPCDLFWPPFTESYYGLVPRYSADPLAAALFEQKLEEYGCMEEYARALEALGATHVTATPEQRARAAVELHPFYEARVDEVLKARSRESERVYNEEKARAEEAVTRIRERLLRIAAERPFRFVATHWDDAVDYIGRLTDFEGFDENEMYGARCTQGTFPHVYAAFLRQMGRARGVLFEGSEADAGELSEYRDAAEEILKRCGVESFLDADSVVFMLHQGYSFCYFQAGYGIYDSPVFQYVECEPAPKQVAPGFAEFL